MRPTRPVVTSEYPYGTFVRLSVGRRTWRRAASVRTNIREISTEKLDVPATRTPNIKKRMKKSSRSVGVMNCSPSRLRSLIGPRSKLSAARNVSLIGGEVEEPLYAKSKEVGQRNRLLAVLEGKLLVPGGVGGFAKTVNKSGSMTLVMMARTRMPKRMFVKNGDTIWPTVEPRISWRKR